MICKFPQKYLFLTGGSSFPFETIPDVIFELWLSCIYRALIGVNYLQIGKIYFEAVQRDVCCR